MNELLAKLLDRMKSPPSVLVILNDADDEEPESVSEIEIGQTIKVGEEIRDLARYFRTDELAIMTRLVLGEMIVIGHRSKARYHME